MTITEWLAKARRTVSDACWCCGHPQTKTGFIGYGVPFFCDRCQVGWAVQIPKE